MRWSRWASSPSRSGVGVARSIKSLRTNTTASIRGDTTTLRGRPIKATETALAADKRQVARRWRHWAAKKSLPRRVGIVWLIFDGPSWLRRANFSDRSMRVQPDCWCAVFSHCDGTGARARGRPGTKRLFEPVRPGGNFWRGPFCFDEEIVANAWHSLLGSRYGCDDCPARPTGFRGRR